MIRSAKGSEIILLFADPYYIGLKLIRMRLKFQTAAAFNMPDMYLYKYLLLWFRRVNVYPIDKVEKRE